MHSDKDVRATTELHEKLWHISQILLHKWGGLDVLMGHLGPVLRHDIEQQRETLDHYTRYNNVKRVRAERDKLIDLLRQADIYAQKAGKKPLPEWDAIGPMVKAFPDATIEKRPRNEPQPL